MSSVPAPNPFTPPRSDLRQPSSLAAPPSIEEALSRGYDFDIGAVLGEAWRRTSGIKGSIIGGFAIFYAALFALSFVLVFILAAAGLLGQENSLARMLIGLLSAALSYPIFAGLLMIGIRQAAGQPSGFHLVFGYFASSLALVVTGVLMSVLLYIGFLLLLLPGIYLSIAYALALPLVVERGLSPWQALETSRKAISQHWFKVFGLLASLSMLVFVSALPLGLGLIWTLPMTFVALGVLYREIFGVLPATE